MKLMIILAILKPSLATARVLLAARDANSTGWDDFIANQIEALEKSIASYETNPDGEPPNPSLWS